MFLSDPDAPASTLTQRDVLRLALFHAYVSQTAPALEAAARAIEYSALILDAEELEAGPAPADDVVGAVTDAARPDRFENAAPRAESAIARAEREAADLRDATQRAAEVEQDRPPVENVPAFLLGEDGPTLELDNLGGSPE